MVDAPMIVILPFQSTLDKLLATQVVAGGPLSPPQHILDDALGRYAGVVAAGEEQGREAAHAMPADQINTSCSAVPRA